MILKWIFDRVVSLLELLFLWPVLLECKDGRWEPLGEGKDDGFASLEFGVACYFWRRGDIKNKRHYLGCHLDNPSC